MSQTKGANIRDVTLVIPTHERRQYLKRVMSYYAQYRLNIIVADSSRVPIKKSQKEAGFEYVHLPGNSLVEKIEFSLKKTRTDYALICADDDFFIPSGIRHCTSFLRANPDYASAQGNYISFLFHGGDVSFSPDYLQMKQTDINGVTAKERVEALSGNYFHFSYAVHRTDFLTKMYAVLNEAGVSNYNLIELLVALAAVIKGKHRVLDCLYAAREQMTDQNKAFHKSKEVIEYADSWDIRENQQTVGQFEKFMNLGKTFLDGQSSAGGNSSMDIIEEFYNTYESKHRIILKEDLKAESEEISFWDSMFKKMQNMLGKEPLSTQELRQRRSEIRVECSPDHGLFAVRKAYPYMRRQDEQEIEKLRLIVMKHANLIYAP